MNQRFITLAALGLMLGFTAFGASYTFHSGPGSIGTQTYTGGPGSSVGSGSTNAIAPHPEWAPPFGGASWVSHDTTYIPDPQVPDGTYVDFFHDFHLAGLAIVGTPQILVYADDRADVWLNGQSLHTTPNNPGSACNTDAIGCIVGKGKVIDLLPALQLGNNTLQVRVYQDNAVAFGTLYSLVAGTQLTTTDDIPEPSSYMLIGGGLSALAVMFRRRAARNS